MRRKSTVKRMEERIEDLQTHFSRYVSEFESLGIFTGPSLYFHRRTTSVLRDYGDVAKALQDPRFLELIYATLTAWGMHRMGPGGAKLVDFRCFCESLLEQVGAIQELEPLSIDEFSPEEAMTVGGELWEIIDELKAGVGDTKIVAGAKTLHHVLPDIMPPIDGQYTLSFFYGSRGTALSPGEEVAFLEMYPRFCRIASTCKDEIAAFLRRRPASDSAMRTSKTKMIDNAIVGYWYSKNPDKG